MLLPVAHAYRRCSYLSRNLVPIFLLAGGWLRRIESRFMQESQFERALPHYEVLTR